MNWLEFLLRLAGIGQLALAAAHALFPRPLAWHEELARLSPVNRQIFWVHTYFIVLILVLCGSLALFYAPDLMTPHSRLARAVVGGHVIFWGFRLYSQLFVYSSELWRGDALKTRVHILFTVMWLSLTAVYAAVLVGQMYSG